MGWKAEEETPDLKRFKIEGAYKHRLKLSNQIGRQIGGSKRSQDLRRFKIEGTCNHRLKPSLQIGRQVGHKRSMRLDSEEHEAQNSRGLKSRMLGFTSFSRGGREIGRCDCYIRDCPVIVQ